MTTAKATNIVWHEGHVNRAERERLLAQSGCLVWLTGLPSSGKSTIAFTAEHALVSRGHMAYVLDGDNIRHGLNRNLGFRLKTGLRTSAVSARWESCSWMRASLRSAVS